MQQKVLERLPQIIWDNSSPRQNIIEMVGNTPLIKINRLTEGLPKSVEIYAKLECYNPGGSVKDRAAKRMIEDAEKAGRLTKDKIILDSTSGNTGIAYAWIGAVKGYGVELVVPANVSEERKRILKAFGAKVVFSDPLEGSDGAIRLAWKLYVDNPEKYCKLDQYNNPSNPLSHYDTTGPEIIEQTNGRVTHFVASIGTSGTIMGTGRRLKEFNPAIQVIAVEPATPLHGLEGLKHMATSIVPGIYHEEKLDGKVPAPTEESYDMAKRLAREEGLFVGQSSGAAMWAGLQVAKKLKEGVIVILFPDGGDRYLSTRLWD
ncbi:MAG: cysteine synthase [Deltaproteobacteria bacterium RIFOXYA2_FULL_42_10]|nr:MAG: cysteine synthase [Deltaproteobacteria bacterium GWB2_42_7]OGP41925.1 MAG: cysteine synthase [Deltaproteobacteria bacterium GWD2_42_10]OGQ26973.1 MAG: cysteine synthase [Deltaproteobacteria bacterium RIFCSPHIGHO2_02_FULL_42_44]OGQ38110.1 MAG: cysteine synthase [Deltaproteobacteria bacterium RIFCSPLOWO2_02_FULL_42_39]OGQ66755.1 MAG: cysteine synthase [Deltaproteobacteria bacterium RIFCSPLOWO2_12_FULL_42_16]OGQ74121.1 MAG: cysteine synthase [Deltaproteobacteria bacterium RIFOXYA2_FULL_42